MEKAAFCNLHSSIRNRLSGRRDSNPWPSAWQADVIPLNYARIFGPLWRSYSKTESAESQNRTGDTAIFSRVLYQLSYLGL